MRRHALLLVLACACGDNLKARPDAQGDPRIDAPTSTELKHCLDSPQTIVLPPSGQLPCDLLPPGFGP